MENNGLSVIVCLVSILLSLGSIYFWWLFFWCVYDLLPSSIKKWFVPLDFRRYSGDYSVKEYNCSWLSCVAILFGCLFSCPFGIFLFHFIKYVLVKVDVFSTSLFS